MTREFLVYARELKEKIIAFFKAQSVTRKILIVALFFIVLVSAGFITLFILVWSGAFGRLPDKEELALVENPVGSEVYSADSVLLGRYFIHERSNIRSQDIPEHVENAVLATEDIRFYEHRGVDTRSMVRVVLKSILLQQESAGGGSTITQQLAKNLYPRKKYALLSLPINKIREMIIASRLEDVFDKKSILTLYLNTIPFGDNTFGIETASQRFFSVPTRSLAPEQAAVLVGMLKATYSYNPRIFPDRALKRRNVVLAQMNKYEMLSDEEATKLKALPLKLAYNRITHHSGLAPYFREYIRQELLEWCRTHKKENGESYNLYTDGLRIYTTVDSRLQRYAEEAVKTQMTVIQKKFNQHWGKRSPWYNQPQVLDEAIKRSERHQSLKEKGLSESEIREVMNTPVLMNIFTWEGEKETTMTPMDSIRHYLSFLNAGVLMMDPRQGAIKAWVGGIDHHFFQYDHVRESTRRQVGSTFKPIVYAAALEQGAQPCDFISAEKTIYTNVNNAEWAPENTDNEKYDLKFSMEGALTYSVNTVSVKVLERAGIANTVALAHKMGVKSDMPPVPSLALGVADISVSEMVSAYSCFVNKGKAVTPFYITSITDPEGEILEAYKPVTPEQALSPETAQMILQMLRRTVEEGTASGLRHRYGLQNDIGGKTGTTQSNADGWFIGVTPRLVIGAWVGADDPRVRFRSTALGQGASTALPIVAEFLKRANKDKTLRSLTHVRFPEPSSEVKDKLSCSLYKSDENFFEKLFGKEDEEKQEIRRAFGEEVKPEDEKEVAETAPLPSNKPIRKAPVRKKKNKKDGFLKRLFGKN